jgi:hypothetical protein
MVEELTCALFDSKQITLEFCGTSGHEHVQHGSKGRKDEKSHSGLIESMWSAVSQLIFYNLIGSCEMTFTLLIVSWQIFYILCNSSRIVVPHSVMQSRCSRPWSTNYLLYLQMYRIVACGMVL